MSEPCSSSGTSRLRFSRSRSAPRPCRLGVRGGSSGEVHRQRLLGPGDRREVVPSFPEPTELRALCGANVREQARANHHVVTAALPQGDLTAAQLLSLADLALAHGDGTVRLAPLGKVHLRDVFQSPSAWQGNFSLLACNPRATSTRRSRRSTRS